MLSIVKSFKILFKQNGYSFFSEFFALNGYIFVKLTNKKLSLPLYSRLNTNLISHSVKLIEHIASALVVVLSNPYVGPLPRTRIYVLFIINIH